MSKGPPMPNLPRVLLRAALRVMAWTLLLLVGLATPLKRGISFRRTPKDIQPVLKLFGITF